MSIVMEHLSDAIYMNVVRDDFRLICCSLLAEWVSVEPSGSRPGRGRPRKLDTCRREVEAEMEKRRVLLSREDDRHGYGFYGVLYRAESRTHLLLLVQLTDGSTMKDLYLLKKKLDLSVIGFELDRVERKRKSVLRSDVENYWKSVVEKVLGDGEVESVMVGDASMRQVDEDEDVGEVSHDLVLSRGRKRALRDGGTPSVDEVSDGGGSYSVGTEVSLSKRRRKELRMAEMAVELKELEIEKKRAEMSLLEQQLEAERAEEEDERVSLWNVSGEDMLGVDTNMMTFASEEEKEVDVFDMVNFDFDRELEKFGGGGEELESVYVGVEGD